MRGGSRSSRACSAPCTSVGTATWPSVELPRAVAPPQRAALDQILQRLLEEERVAAGALGEQIGERARQRRLGERLGQLAARARRQRPQLDLAVAVREDARARARRAATTAGRDRRGRSSTMPSCTSSVSASRSSTSSSVSESAHCRSSTTTQSGPLLREPAHDRRPPRRTSAAARPRGSARAAPRSPRPRAAARAAARGTGRPTPRLGRGRRAPPSARAGRAPPGASTPMLSQSRRRSRTGQYGKLSAYEPARPSRKRMRSPKRRRASTTSRDLPMPDSPVIETIAPLPSAIAWQASSSTASSRARPTTRHDGAHLGRPARARHARGAQRPLEPAQLDLAERLELDAVLHLALGLGPDDDAAVGRELLQPRGDVGGVAERVVAVRALVVVGEHDRARVERDAHAQVDAVAARAAPRRRSAIAVWIASAARTARSASSSCPTGAPKSANRPSPASCATVPSKRRTSPRDQRDDLVEEELRALGPEPLADRRRADDVGEQRP